MAFPLPSIRCAAITAHGSSYDPVVLAWQSRCIANGSSGPSAGTLTAANTFYTSLTSAGIHTKMKSVNIFAPDDLSCSLTPFIATLGFNLWANKSTSGGAFGGADLTVNGLKGNNLKYLETGVSASAFTTASNGISMMSYDRVVEDKKDIGVDIPGDIALYLQSSYFNGFYYVYGQPGVGNDQMFYNHGNTYLAGYFSGNRTARNAGAIYFASGSTNPHSQLTSSVLNHTIPNTMPTAQMFVYGINRLASGVDQVSSRRYSFVALHEGLTTAESLALYNAVKALRTSLGGGYL